MPDLPSLTRNAAARPGNTAENREQTASPASPQLLLRVSVWLLAALILVACTLAGQFTASAVSQQQQHWKQRLLSQQLTAMRDRMHSDIDTVIAAFERMSARLSRGTYEGINGWRRDADTYRTSFHALKGLYLWFPALQSRWESIDGTYRAGHPALFELTPEMLAGLERRLSDTDGSNLLVPVALDHNRYGFRLLQPFTALNGERGYLIALFDDELLFSRHSLGSVQSEMELRAELILPVDGPGAHGSAFLELPDYNPEQHPTTQATRLRTYSTGTVTLNTAGIEVQFRGWPSDAFLTATEGHQATLIRVVFMLAGLVLALALLAGVRLHRHARAEHAAKEETENMARAKSAFLSTMSHEVRTPMNGVLGLTELLSDTRLDEHQRQIVRTIQRSGEGLISILNDILDHSRLEAGKLDIEQVSFDLHSLLDDLQQLLAERARSRSTSLQLAVDPELPRWVKGDAHRLRQVLLNLLSNALKFTEHGTVTLGAQASQDERISFAVTDTGIGIRENELERIFDAFSQADNSISRRFGGTGLGLDISRKLVEAMGGTISVESTYGVGSCFSVHLPLPAAARPTSNPDQAGEVQATGKLAAELLALRILAAEDNKVNQVVLQGFLRKMGLEADMAADGEEAVRMSQQGQYDLVLMDMQMPVMDGLEATRRILARVHEHPAARPPVIIAQTANAQRQDREACLEVGMFDVICKPLTYQSLYQAIEKWGRIALQTGKRVA